MMQINSTALAGLSSNQANPSKVEEALNEGRLLAARDYILVCYRNSDQMPEQLVRVVEKIVEMQRGKSSEDLARSDYKLEDAITLTASIRNLSHMQDMRLGLISNDACRNSAIRATNIIREAYLARNDFDGALSTLNYGKPLEDGCESRSVAARMIKDSWKTYIETLKPEEKVTERAKMKAAISGEKLYHLHLR